MSNCQQKRCCFLGTPLCPVCSECQAEPNIVSGNCTTCWNCEHDEGELRGKVNFRLLEIQKDKIKEDDIKVFQ